MNHWPLIISFVALIVSDGLDKLYGRPAAFAFLFGCLAGVVATAVMIEKAARR